MANKLTEQDATLLNQAHEMLLDLAKDQWSKGNDSAAMGAECSADALLRLAASAAAPAAQPAVPEIDYQALIHAAFKHHGHAQGTRGCVAFKHGAEWFRSQMQAANEQTATLPEHADHVADIAARLRLVAKLAGCPQAVPENDHTAVGAIFSVLGNMRRELERKQPAQVQVIGIKDGAETLLGTAPMPARMKARELAREQFGHFDDDDGSDAELCFGAMEQLIDHMERSAKHGFTPATK